MKRRIHINHAVLVLGFIAISTLGCGNDPTVENDDTLSPEEEYLSEYDGPSEKWGFLDTKGLLAIDPRYDQVSSFTEGLAIDFGASSAACPPTVAYYFSTRFKYAKFRS